jgi:hypothetical protein
MDTQEIKDFLKSLGRKGKALPAVAKPAAPPAERFQKELRAQLARFEKHHVSKKFGKNSFVSGANKTRTGVEYSVGFGFEIGGQDHFSANSPDVVRLIFAHIQSLLDANDPELLEAISKSYAENPNREKPAKVLAEAPIEPLKKKRTRGPNKPKAATV